MALAVAAALPAAAFFALSWAFPFSLGTLDDARAARQATAVLDREGSILRVFTGRDDSWMIWVGMERVNPRLVQATLAIEDQRFYGHPGVDPLAVLRAGWQDVTRWRTVSGASTVTMQLMRLVGGATVGLPDRAIAGRSTAGQASRGTAGESPFCATVGLPDRAVGSEAIRRTADWTRQPWHAPEDQSRRSRTWRRKLVEAFRALQIERLLSKPQILEWYLNLAPYGGNRVGVEAASLAYFGKHASDLTLAEAALLAGLPQSPSRLRPDRNPERAKARRDHVLQRMFACGYITRDELAAALSEAVRVTHAPAPVDGLHFALLVSQRSEGAVPRLACPAVPDSAGTDRTVGQADRGTPGAFGVLRTTLDRRMQGLSERAIREAVDRLRAAGITNGAVVVIENATGAVRALVGSCDFFSVVDRGQVNGATAPRSPGSALKPFTYALAFELGLATPDSILADVPANYSGYEPEDYDRQFRGPVSAREALVNSLNIPAVRLCEQVGLPALYGFLRDLGITTLTRDARHYGLALTLGSADVTLLELTNAYATLARLGIYRPYRLLEGEGEAPAEPSRFPEAARPEPRPPTEPRPGRRLLSEGAAYLVAEVLADTGRLEGCPSWRPASAGARMAWKTGTSYGHRDAWTFAYTPEFTVGVWLGNFSGRPSGELIGVRAAAPVAAKILDQLHGGRGRTWYSAPSGAGVPPASRQDACSTASVGTRRVCAVSGMPVGSHCPHATDGLFVRGRSPDRVCSVHLEVQVDEKAGVRLCPLCATGHEHTVRVMEVWPTELAAWLRQHGRGASLAPPHFGGCARRDEGEPPPVILSPASGQRYVLQENDGAARQRLLLRAASRCAIVYWFIDGTLHATGVPLESAFWPLQRGSHTIVCSDDAGRSTSVAIEVR